MEPESDLNQRRRFRTTHWSVVLRAGRLDSDDGQQAWSDLIHCYWYPLYAYCRQQGSASHDAQDLTQGFFAHLLDRHGLKSVEESKGRFRTFLLAAFKNYIVNQHRADHAVKRGGSVTIHSLNHSDFDARFAQEASNSESPEQAFDRRWVEALLDHVRERLREEYATALKLPLFEQLQPHLTNDLQALPYAEIGRKLNISPAAVAMSIHRMRRRYGELLYEEVATTVDDPRDVEDELRNLMSIVSQSA